jgi:hypothetical protein
MTKNSRRTSSRVLAAGTALLSLSCLSAASQAQDFHRDRDHDRQFSDRQFWPGNLVVSRTVYDNNPNNVKVGTVLPPNCAPATDACGAATGAPYNGTYPLVWNNDIYDASFGITAKIYLDQITPYGFLINSLEVPNNAQRGINSKSDQLVTSFSSKSEIALNLSTDRRYLTFMGYVSPIDAIDVSNSNTPAAVDATNPVGENNYRAVASVDAFGRFHFTETNAYSGNNGRAAVLYDTEGENFFYTSGNAGNGANPQPAGVVLGAGTQIIDPSKEPEAEQNPGTPTPVGSFSVTLLGAKADKVGKDDNYRGLTIFNNVLYYTKGSGSNGVNTVYFLDTTGTACPKGVGLPSASATLPASPLTYDPSTVVTTGLPSNICILSGFPSMPNKSLTTITAFPFGIWFADANTFYVADEGDGYTAGADLYTHAAEQTTAGLQKWVFNGTTWTLAYTLQGGLGLGSPYQIHGYPTGNNPGTNLPWAPATDGLRNITGRVNHDGTVTIWAITSTVSGNGDTGADPNRLVAITDQLKNTTATKAAGEKFVTVRQAGFAEALRGVAFTPDAETSEHHW